VLNNLGQVTQCVSRVTTRLRYVHRLGVETLGSQRLGPELLTRLDTLEVYVVSVSIKLNVQNGGSDTNDLVSGEALLNLIERTLEENKI
jgi:hypothetical protein